MTMTKVSVAIAFVALASIVNAIDHGFLRRGFKQIDLQCTLEGSTDKSTCDSTESEDGSKCVWCTGLTNVCISKEYADQIKQFGFNCDDDSKDDDDDTPSKKDDDDDDDDVAPTDDTVPDNYWDCRTKYDSSEKCKGAGCVWCETKGGYEICMDDKTAETASDSYWYTCDKSPTSDSSYNVFTTTMKELLAGVDKGLSSPFDPTCLLVTLQHGDKSACEATMDNDNKKCEWCSFQGNDLCLNEDQAQILEQSGGECTSNNGVRVDATSTIASS